MFSFSISTEVRRTLGGLLTAFVVLALIAPAAGQAIASPAQQTGPTGFEVGIHFQTYYRGHDGLRLLGYAVSEESLLEDSSAQARTNIPVQLFQKGRMEYQGNMGLTGRWEYTYGLLVPEMIERVNKANDLGISGTSITYMQLRSLADPGRKVAPPAGFKGGTQKMPGGLEVFIPQSPTLAVASGYLVPAHFWNYMNSGVFPAGWLHDLGLPVSVTFQGTAMKNSAEHAISMQAYERGILTYDPKNPDGFKVERANIGADYQSMLKQSRQAEEDAVGRAQVIVRAYWQAVDDANYGAAYEMLSNSYKAQATLNMFKTQTSGAIAHATAVQFTDTKQQPDGSLQFTVQINIAQGPQPSNYNNGLNVRFFTLVQESGVWRIAAITTSP